MLPVEGTKRDITLSVGDFSPHNFTLCRGATFHEDEVTMHRNKNPTFGTRFTILPVGWCFHDDDDDTIRIWKNITASD